MLKTLLTKPTSTVGLAYTAYRLWRRIPKRHRRRIIQETRKHVPRIARSVAQRRRTRVRR